MELPKQKKLKSYIIPPAVQLDLSRLLYLVESTISININVLYGVWVHVGSVLFSELYFEKYRVIALFMALPQFNIISKSIYVGYS